MEKIADKETLEAEFDEAGESGEAGFIDSESEESGEAGFVDDEGFIDPVVYPFQENHFQKLLAILKKYHIAIDASEPGTGKTHIALAITFILGLPIIVLGPASMTKITWDDAVEMYDPFRYEIIDGSFYCSYDSWRTTKGSQPRHGLLIRQGDTFTPTSKLRKMIDRGVLLICDEAQAMKNANITLNSLKPVFDLIRRSEKSRALLLSGSIIDKAEQIPNLLYLFGILKVQNVRATSGFEPLSSLVAWTGDSKLQSAKFPKKKKDRIQFVFDVFSSHIRKNILSIMPKGKIGRATLDIKNRFYYINDSDSTGNSKFDDALRRLEWSVDTPAQPRQLILIERTSDN